MPSTVFERAPGSWAARVTIAGQQVWLGTHPSREEARAAVFRAGRGELPNTMTVQEWQARWALMFPGKRRLTTEQHNATMVRQFCRAYGDKRLRDIDMAVAQPWAVAHPSQVRYLRLMFDKAVRAGILPVNVWKAVEPSRAGGATPHAPRRPPTLGELEALVGAARRRYGDNVADMLVFTAYTGLRLSEMADVQACDMHPGGRRLLVRGKRRAGETEPRERTVTVFAAARDAYHAHAPEVGAVWRTVQGRRWRVDSVQRCFGLIRDDAGIRDLTFHSLRHFHASWLLDQGASELDVAVQLGHLRRDGTADPGLVRRVYGHPDVSAALARLEAL